MPQSCLSSKGMLLNMVNGMLFACKKCTEFAAHPVSAVANRGMGCHFTGSWRNILDVLLRIKDTKIDNDSGMGRGRRRGNKSLVLGECKMRRSLHLANAGLLWKEVWKSETCLCGGHHDSPRVSTQRLTQRLCLLY